MNILYKLFEMFIASIIGIISIIIILIYIPIAIFKIIIDFVVEFIEILLGGR